MHPGKRAFLAQLAKEIEAERFEERAAILEYDAGYTRAEAERLARLASPNVVERWLADSEEAYFATPSRKRP